MIIVYNLFILFTLIKIKNNIKLKNKSKSRHIKNKKINSENLYSLLNHFINF